MEQKTCKILQSTHKKYALHELNWNLSRQSIRWCNTWTFWFRQCPAGQRCNDEGNCLHFLGSQGEAWCKSSVTQGPLPSWINKCMSNLQSLQYLQWTLKDAPWRLWRVSHPILSLIGLSRGEDQKLPTSLLRKGCKFLLQQTWNHITDRAATEFPTVGQVALPGALPQRPTWGLKDLLRSDVP